QKRVVRTYPTPASACVRSYPTEATSSPWVRAPPLGTSARRTPWASTRQATGPRRQAPRTSSRFRSAAGPPGVLRGDGAPGGLITRPAESHRQRPKLLIDVGSPRGVGCHGKPPVSLASAEPAA